MEAKLEMKSEAVLLEKSQNSLSHKGKILFVIPGLVGIMGKPTSPHFGIASLAGVARDLCGYDVRIIDMRLGYNDDYVINAVKEFKPDYYATTTVTQGHGEVYNLIRKAKAIDSNIKVIIGGPHTSATVKEVLNESGADIAVIREGEMQLKEILNGAPLENVLGIAFKRGNDYIVNPERPFLENLDELPVPAYDLFELANYMDKKLPMVTSRGCPHRCIFCSIFLTMGRTFRTRSPEHVVNEIEHWYKKYGYRRFAFNDDVFNFDKERVKKICDLIVERGLKIQWELRNGIRVDKVDLEMFQKMKKAGCIYIAFGIESGVQDVLNKMKKGATVEQIKRAAQLTKEAGLPAGGFFIIGLPGDNMENFKQTLKLALELPLEEVRFYSALPYIGTEFYEIAKKNGWFTMSEEDYQNNIGVWDGQPVIETQDFTKEERKKALEIGEKFVMKYISKKEFGPVIGTIAYWVWLPKPTRGIMKKVGIKTWAVLRKIKNSIIYKDAVVGKVTKHTSSAN
ncbi:radical SAM protein [Candidatus Woesearchaeota archaeon]|nr:radical SAM protein [Candidatus Woesearchaeota archaeon]